MIRGHAPAHAEPIWDNRPKIERLCELCLFRFDGGIEQCTQDEADEQTLAMPWRGRHTNERPTDQRGTLRCCMQFKQVAHIHTAATDFVTLAASPTSVMGLNAGVGPLELGDSSESSWAFVGISKCGSLRIGFGIFGAFVGLIAFSATASALSDSGISLLGRSLASKIGGPLSRTSDCRRWSSSSLAAGF